MLHINNVTFVIIIIYGDDNNNNNNNVLIIIDDHVINSLLIINPNLWFRQKFEIIDTRKNYTYAFIDIAGSGANIVILFST